MSAYNGRRGPNVSQYLRDLNTAKPQQDSADDNINFEDDLAMFTNTQFFDYDSGQAADFQGQPPSADASTSTPATASSPDAISSTPNAVMGDLSSLDFMSADFNFPDFSNAYVSPTLGTFPDAHALVGLQSLQPGQPVYNPAASQQAPTFTPPPPRTGEKRKSDAGHGSLNFEDASRHAAEEDKRRRNTAASARFRVKKKQREQALEKSAKEMTEKVTVLEGRINQLETENKWLKNLIMEKNGSKEDIAAMLRDLGNKRPSEIAEEIRAAELLKAESS